MTKERILKRLGMGLGMRAVPETVMVAGKERKNSSGWLWTWAWHGTNRPNYGVFCFSHAPRGEASLVCFLSPFSVDKSPTIYCFYCSVWIQHPVWCFVLSPPSLYLGFLARLISF